MRHLIIGAGAAGITAAEELRRLDPLAQISVLDGEGEGPYSRMAIPYFLAAEIADNGTRMRRDAAHFREQHIEIERGRAARLDAAARTVHLEDGRALGYDRLLIATGSVPTRENIPGIDLPGVHTCWTLADARALVQAIRPGTRVVQMGAGFVGCIILKGLLARGAALTVLIRSGRMVSRMMPPKASEIIAQWCEARGIRIMPKTQAARIDRDGTALKVMLTTGEVLPADIYLSVVGVGPGIAFLEGSGIAIGNGIVVDEHMRTNLPDVYAAGDVAEAVDRLSGKPLVNAIQPNAVEQGRVAAANMAGGHMPFAGSLAMNVLDTLGLVSMSFGQWNGVAPEQGGSGVELVDAENFRYLGLQFQDDVLIGATGIGHTEHVGALRGLIQTRTHLGKWKRALIEDPSAYMEAYLAVTRKTT
jgi:NAD(P)H-nitrite reductase large subunit